MEAQERGSGSPAWSWGRARETVMVLAAAVACFGVLIAGMTYAVHPVHEDLRVLQATTGNVRERLAAVEVGLDGVGKELGGLKKELANVREDVESLKAGQVRILALLESRASDL